MVVKYREREVGSSWKKMEMKKEEVVIYSVKGRVCGEFQDYKKDCTSESESKGVLALGLRKISYKPEYREQFRLSTTHHSHKPSLANISTQKRQN